MQTGTLARLLRKSHRISHSWRDTGKEFGITGGLAFRIALEGYDPANAEIRERLGLGPRPCPTCHRRTTAPVRIRRWHSLDELKPQEIAFVFEHREEVSA